MSYTTADSGDRARFASGMVRDTEAGKPRFDLLLPLGIPYRDQFLSRVADLMARGAEKYDARNWEQACSTEELARYRSSAYRHLIQWLTGDDDPPEDHAAAVVFNLLAHETTRWKLDHAEPELGPNDYVPRRAGDWPTEEDLDRYHDEHVSAGQVHDETCAVCEGYYDEPATAPRPWWLQQQQQYGAEGMALDHTADRAD